MRPYSFVRFVFVTTLLAELILGAEPSLADAGEPLTAVAVEAEAARPWLAEHPDLARQELEYAELNLRVAKADLGRRVFAFGLICTQGTQCNAGASQSDM